MHCPIAIVIIPFFFNLITHSSTQILLLLSLCNDQLTLMYFMLVFVCLFISLNYTIILITCDTKAQGGWGYPLCIPMSINIFSLSLIIPDIITFG